MSDNPHVMSKYATEIDCLRARDKWHKQRIAELERENAELRKDAERYRAKRRAEFDAQHKDTVAPCESWLRIEREFNSQYDADIDAAMKKENGNG